MGHRAGGTVSSIGISRADRSCASFQSVDESRPRDGMDQYQDHFRDSVFWTHHPDGGDHADVWLGLDAKSAEPRCRKLSSRAAGEATQPHDQAILNQRRQYGRVPNRAVGLCERTAKILAVADYCDARAIGKLDRADARISGGSVYLHVVLILKTQMLR